MDLAIDLLLLLVIVQTALRLSRMPLWTRLLTALSVGVTIVVCIDWASGLSKPQVETWLHDLPTLRNIAVICLLDAMLSRLRWYPGILIFPVAIILLAYLLFNMVGSNFMLVGWSLAACLAAGIFLTPTLFTWLLPRQEDRKNLHLLVTVMLCSVSLLSTLPTVTVFPPTHQNIIMEYISKILFGIANILLIPDIILLIFFFIRSLILLVTTYMQYQSRKTNSKSRLYSRYTSLLYDHEPDEAYADYLATQFEAEAAKEVNQSRLLTKLGPVLGLIGTLISMSPALVGLSTGDISGMAYNMQVVFSATVVGLFISVVGLFTQQMKTRWYAKDLGKLDYVSRLYAERHEKEEE